MMQHDPQWLFKQRARFKPLNFQDRDETLATRFGDVKQ
jgi:hypothetical protein